MKFELDRLQKRREQQSRTEAKTQVVEQIDSCLHTSDYARALDLLEKAAAEFPNDPELHELEKLAQEGVQRKTEAQKLMTEGQELCAKQEFVEGTKLLRRAYELDENNSLTRAMLSNALVEQATLAGRVELAGSRGVSAAGTGSEPRASNGEDHPHTGARPEARSLCE